MNKLLDLKFLVCIMATACVQWALLAQRIDANTYSILLSMAVGAFLALEWKNA